MIRPLHENARAFLYSQCIVYRGVKKTKKRKEK